MATYTGTSILGRQQLGAIPNPSTIVSFSLRGASLGQTGKIGWIAIERNTGTPPVVEWDGREFWRNGQRLFGTWNAANLYGVVYWRYSGLLWQLDTA